MQRTVLFALAMAGAIAQASTPSIGIVPDRILYHVRLYKDGGAIEVDAVDPTDPGYRGKVRTDLQRLAQMFGRGNFDDPMLGHDPNLPGVFRNAATRG